MAMRPLVGASRRGASVVTMPTGATTGGADLQGNSPRGVALCLGLPITIATLKIHELESANQNEHKLILDVDNTWARQVGKG